MESTTYEQVLELGDWAYPDKPAYILTTRNLSTVSPNISFLAGSIKDVAAAIATKGYRRIWLVGGGRVATSFMEQGLIEEFVVTLIPTILGSEISLYPCCPPASAPPRFKLLTPVVNLTKEFF